VAKRVKISVWPLLERARLLRQDAARLVRQMAKTNDEIDAHTKVSSSRQGTSDLSMQPKKEKPG
jgi:hypothetical protein